VQIKISARHGHLGEPTQQFIREKVEKLLRFFERLTSIEVTVDLKNDVKIVELIVSAEHKHDSWPASRTVTFWRPWIWLSISSSGKFGATRRRSKITVGGLRSAK